MYILVQVYYFSIFQFALFRYFYEHFCKYVIFHFRKGQTAFIQKESIASGADELPTPWLVYFSALNSEARRKAMVSAVSATPGISLLLMAGKNLTITQV